MDLKKAEARTAETTDFHGKEELKSKQQLIVTGPQ
jgi:hypothetical protein